MEVKGRGCIIKDLPAFQPTSIDTHIFRVLLPSPHLLLVQTDRNGHAWQQTHALRAARLTRAWASATWNSNQPTLNPGHPPLSAGLFCQAPLDLNYLPSNTTPGYIRPTMLSGCGEKLWEYTYWGCFFPLQINAESTFILRNPLFLFCTTIQVGNSFKMSTCNSVPNADLTVYLPDFNLFSLIMRQQHYFQSLISLQPQ